MPRPKVKPQDRQRCVIACAPCKKLKVRCDAATPCSTCVKRGRETTCIYEDFSDRPTRRGRRRSAGSDTNAKQLKPLGTLATQQFSAPTEAVEDHDGTSNEEHEDNDIPKSRMLLNSRFQTVYLGETASLSYLQFIRQLVHHRVGSCTFTEGEFNNFMLESEVSAPMDVTSNNLDLDEKKVLVRWYLDATSGILDLFNAEDVFDCLEPSKGLSSCVDAASIQLMLAIGAQCSGASPSEIQYGKSLFAGGQMMAFADMLCDTSVDKVRQFLLMSFYMTAACHRNAAFMYLGVAAKAALAIGLHRAEHYSRLEADECSKRLKTWKSLRILDTIVNSILGRQGGLSGLQHDPRLDKLWHTRCTHYDYPAEIAAQASFDMCPFMDELERKGPNQDVKSAQEFLHRLQSWSKALPKRLRRATDRNLEESTTGDRALHTGGLHVACMYYFAVILATRRYFTLCMLTHLKQSTRLRGESSREENAQGESESLAQVCLDAAISLAKIGHDALQCERLMNNMCILKAWLFAAGLIVGLSRFAQPTGLDYEVQEALLNAQEVLGAIAKYSPQASHYRSILTALLEAIGLHQRKHAIERKRMTSQYLDQIFTLDQNKDSKNLTSMSDTKVDGNLGTDDIWNPDIRIPELEGGSQLNIFDEITEATFAGDSAWLTDDFSSDWQPFSL